MAVHCNLGSVSTSQLYRKSYAGYITVDISIRMQLVKLLKYGNHLLKSRQYAEACQAFEEALLLAPGNLYFMTRAGDTLRRQKDYSTAAGYYRQVLEIEPNNPFALRGFGYALRGLLQYGDAIEIWKRYLGLKGFKNVFVLTQVADCFKAINNYEDSRTYYQNALSLKTNNRNALIGLADLYQKQGLEIPAIEYYEKALANGVIRVNILTIVGNLHYRQGNYEKARICYEKALVQEPDNSYALYGLGNYYRWKSDYRRAVELYEKILEKNDGTVNLYSRLGDAYRNLGQYEAAERVYTSNLAKNYNMYSMVGMIKLRSLQGRLKEACDCYDELLRNEGEDKNVFSDIGRLLIQRHMHSLALQFFRHALQRQNKHSSISRIIEDRIRELEALSRDAVTITDFDG